MRNNSFYQLNLINFIENHQLNQINASVSSYTNPPVYDFYLSESD